MISTYIRNNILGFIAIFIALGGVGMAAGTLKKNSVKSKTIKDGQVLTQDLGADAVDGTKVKDNSLTGADVNEGSLQIPANAVDTSGLQARVSGDCQVGESIRAIAADGTVACQGAGGPPSGVAGGDLTGTYPNPDIAGSAVGSAEVAADSLTTADLGPSSVGTSEVAADSLTSSDLAPDSVAASEITTDSVGSSEIIVAGVDSSEIADNAVGSSDVAADSLGAADLAPASVATSEVVDDSLAAGDLAPSSVGTSEVAADSLGAGDLAPDSVAASEIATNGVDSAEILASAVDSSEIATNSVGASELGSVVVERSSSAIDFNETKELVVACPAGFEAIAGGGGSNIHGVNADIRVIASVPSASNGDALSDGDPIGAWTTVMINGGGFAETGEAYAVCLD